MNMIYNKKVFRCLDFNSHNLLTLRNCNNVYVIKTKKHNTIIK